MSTELHRVRYTFGQEIWETSDIVPTSTRPIGMTKELARTWRWRVHEWTLSVDINGESFLTTLSPPDADKPVVFYEQSRVYWSANNDVIGEFGFCADYVDPGDPVATSSRRIILVGGAYWPHMHFRAELLSSTGDFSYWLTSYQPEDVMIDYDSAEGTVDGQAWSMHCTPPDPGNPPATFSLSVDSFWSYQGIYNTANGAVNPGRSPHEGP